MPGIAGTNMLSVADVRPLAGGDEVRRLSGSERATVGSAIEGSSRDAFHLAALLGACLMFAGGLISAIGIQNPRRGAVVTPHAARAAAAGECGRGTPFHDAEPIPGALEPASSAEAPM